MRYTLDLQTMTPTPCSEDKYWEWHKDLEDALQTALGMRIERKETAEAIVSTVFLGKSEGTNAVGQLLFETFVSGGKYHKWLKRYATFGSAMAGHEEVVRRVMNDEAAEIDDYDAGFYNKGLLVDE